MASIVSGPLFLQWVFCLTFIEKLIAFLPARNISQIPSFDELIFRTSGIRNNKYLPVIEILDDTPTLIISKLEEYYPPKKALTVLLQDKSQKKELPKRNKYEEKIPQPGNYMMPPQPQAYLKYPHHDFL